MGERKGDSGRFDGVQGASFSSLFELEQFFLSNSLMVFLEQFTGLLQSTLPFKIHIKTKGIARGVLGCS